METQTSQKPEHMHHHGGLVAIGLFKLVKAIFFSGLGIAAIHFIHKDLGDALLRVATEFKFDPESHFIAVLMGKVDMLDAHRLRQISIGSFGYSALALTEGIGLLMEKVWAEYLTLILSLLFLPWEFYELFAHSSPWRVAILVSNIGVVIYLLWFIRKARELRARAHA